MLNCSHLMIQSVQTLLETFGEYFFPSNVVYFKSRSVEDSFFKVGAPRVRGIGAKQDA